eukprot:SAG25_NODE_12412_length_280_cov_0.900552_1_plen_41_part_01
MWDTDVSRASESCKHRTGTVQTYRQGSQRQSQQLLRGAADT